MTSPLWSYPGIWEGRLDPIGSTATGSGYGYGYTPSYGYTPGGYAWSYGGAYGYFSDHVFCLGKDESVAPWHRLRIGDKVSVEQSLVVTTVHKLLLFSWHMRVPLLPEPRTVVDNGIVHFCQGAASGGRGVILPESGDSGLIIADAGGGIGDFSANDAELPVTIGGAVDGANNGVHRISGIPVSQGDAGSGDRAIIENQNRLALGSPNTATMVNQLDDSGVTVRVHGLQWKGSCWADWGAGWREQVELREWQEHNFIRASLALHVSQYAGPLLIRYSLELEDYT